MGVVEPAASKQRRRLLFNRLIKTRVSADPTTYSPQRQEVLSPVTAMPSSPLFIRKDNSYHHQDGIENDDDVPLIHIMQQPRACKPIYKHGCTHRTDTPAEEDDEEDDKDLIPIALALSPRLGSEQGHYKSVADKYKEKVKKRLAMNNNDHQHNEIHDRNDDDDDIPIIHMLRKTAMQ